MSTVTVDRSIVTVVPIVFVHISGLIHRLDPIGAAMAILAICFAARKAPGTASNKSKLMAGHCVPVHYFDCGLGSSCKGLGERGGAITRATSLRTSQGT